LTSFSFYTNSEAEHSLLRVLYHQQPLWILLVSNFVTSECTSTQKKSEPISTDQNSLLLWNRWLNC